MLALHIIVNSYTPVQIFIQCNLIVIAFFDKTYFQPQWLYIFTIRNFHCGLCLISKIEQAICKKCNKTSFKLGNIHKGALTKHAGA